MFRNSGHYKNDYFYVFLFLFGLRNNLINSHGLWTQRYEREIKTAVLLIKLKCVQIKVHLNKHIFLFLKYGSAHALSGYHTFFNNGNKVNFLIREAYINHFRRSSKYKLKADLNNKSRFNETLQDSLS